MPLRNRQGLVTRPATAPSMSSPVSPQSSSVERGGHPDVRQVNGDVASTLHSLSRGAATVVTSATMDQLIVRGNAAIAGTLTVGQLVTNTSILILILTSPNGTRYQVTVDNAGTLGTTPL